MIACHLTFVKSPFNESMVDAITRTGLGYTTLSYSAFRGQELDEKLKCVKVELEDIKSSWESMSCTILSDGWTIQRSRTIIDFLVACPKGTMFLGCILTCEGCKFAIFIVGGGCGRNWGRTCPSNHGQCCKLCGNWKIVMCKISYYFLDPCALPIA